MSQDQEASKQQGWHEQVVEAITRSPVGFQYLGTPEAYAVASGSDPRRFYTVLVYGVDRELRTCTCDGYRYRDTCKHVKKVP